MVGLLLQLPFGLLALAVARALLRVVERIARAIARQPTFRIRAPSLWWPHQVVGLPRIPALALGHAGRGPPTL